MFTSRCRVGRRPAGKADGGCSQLCHHMASPSDRYFHARTHLQRKLVLESTSGRESEEAICCLVFSLLWGLPAPSLFPSSILPASRGCIRAAVRSPVSRRDHRHNKKKKEKKKKKVTPNRKLTHAAVPDLEICPCKVAFDPPWQTNHVHRIRLLCHYAPVGGKEPSFVTTRVAPVES